MLTAILHGKAGRISLADDEQRVSWRDVFRRSEDLLTSVFFGRLRYLSESSLTRVMAQLVGDQAAASLGPLAEVEFWPRLKPASEAGRSWVEPDVIMWFKNASVIVEVKPPFGGDQSPSQWSRQIQAFAQERCLSEDAYPETTHFVALGRNTLATRYVAENPETYAEFPIRIHVAEWKDLIASLAHIRADACAADMAIIDDWYKAFALFGMQPARFTWPDLFRFSAMWPLSLDGLPSIYENTCSITRSLGSPVTGWESLIAFSSSNLLSQT